MLYCRCFSRFRTIMPFSSKRERNLVKTLVPASVNASDVLQSLHCPDTDTPNKSYGTMVRVVCVAVVFAPVIQRMIRRLYSPAFKADACNHHCRYCTRITASHEVGLYQVSPMQIRAVGKNPLRLKESLRQGYLVLAFPLLDLSTSSERLFCSTLPFLKLPRSGNVTRHFHTISNGVAAFSMFSMFRCRHFFGCSPL